MIESKSNFVEHPELIANRIGNYAKLVGRENVIAGSDCGFGTRVGQAAVDPDVVWAKFATMAEGARIASKRWNVGYDAFGSGTPLSLRKSPARLRKQCAASTLGPGQLSRTDGSNQEALCR